MDIIFYSVVYHCRCHYQLTLIYRCKSYSIASGYIESILWWRRSSQARVSIEKWSIYRECVDALIYLATCSRTDLAYVVLQSTRYAQLLIIGKLMQLNIAILLFWRLILGNLYSNSINEEPRGHCRLVVERLPDMVCRNDNVTDEFV